MKSLDRGHFALSIYIAAAILAGCGGSQPPIGAPGTMPQDIAQQRTSLTPCSGSRLGVAQCGVLIQTPGVRATKPAGWSPADLQSAYKLPSSRKGLGQIVAIVDAFDNPNVATDVAAYRTEFGLPAANFFKYNQEGQQSNYPRGSVGWGVEIDLDVDMVSAACPKCTIYLVEANSNNTSDLQTAETEAVAVGAHIISNSWVCYGSASCVDQSYFSTKGVEYLASSGTGYKQLGAPAIFDSVVSVGGTVLSKGGGGKRGWTEEVWSGTGGGCARQPKPRWQHFKICKHRLVNDVSAVAWGAAEYDSYGYGGWFTVGGTSVATGFLAGVFGLAGNASQQDGGRTFWETAHQKHLYPVPEGHNPECAYTEGNYNTCAGWGSPDGIKAF